MDIQAKQVTAFIGPSGCGKSTLLRCLNRMNDLIDNVRITGTFNVHGQDLYAHTTDVIEVRRRIGMVFQKSNPLPKSIYENVVYGLRIAGIRNKATLDDACERSLRGAALWDEVKDRLHESGLSLSGGQMQRLCIARAIAIEPEIVLMDEPCSALDPIATLKVEELIFALKTQFTIVIVTHNLQQAARVSDKTAFFWLGTPRGVQPHAGALHQPRAEAHERLHHGEIRLMERHFHEELRALTSRVADMGALVESRTRDALTALAERRSDLAVQVASGDAAVNQLELEIDDLCIKFLATQSPVASDLRLVRSVHQGHYGPRACRRPGGEHGARHHRAAHKPPLRPILDVGLLGETALQMLHDSVTGVRDAGCGARPVRARARRPRPTRCGIRSSASS